MFPTIRAQQIALPAKKQPIKAEDSDSHSDSLIPAMTHFSLKVTPALPLISWSEPHSRIPSGKEASKCYLLRKEPDIWGCSTCGGLNKNGPIGSRVSGTTGMCGLVGGSVSLGVGFEVSETQTSSLLSPAIQMLNLSSVSNATPICMPPCFQPW